MNGPGETITEKIDRRGRWGDRRRQLKHLGIAGSTAEFFVQSPLSPLLFISCFVVGVLSLLYTPRQEDPQISVPMVDVFVSYPGATPKQVATLAVEPLERIMSEISGVKHVYSMSHRGGALVTVRFKVGEDLESSLVKLYDRLESNKDLMPPGVGPPLVKPYSVDDVPVVTLTLWSDTVDDSRLRTLAFDVLQKIKEVPDTSKGFVVGGRARQIRIEVLPERLASFNVSLTSIARAVRSANSQHRAGRGEMGQHVFNIHTGIFLRTKEDVGNLVVGMKNNVPIYISDVATVVDGPEETVRLVEQYSGPANDGLLPPASGQQAVTVAIAKKHGSNGVTIAKNILAKMERLKGDLIPDNVYYTVSRDYGRTADRKVDELLMALLEATIAVSVLCLVGMGTRAAIVVISVIPVVILITVFSAWMLSFTIDRVSLFALIFSIGILVDDATVVVENIFRRWLAADSTDAKTLVDAVREVGNPTILATLTIIAALLPMGFISGMMGPYMRPIPILGSVAMLFSLIAAFVFTPWLTWLLRPGQEALRKAEISEKRGKDRLMRVYERFMDGLIRNRVLGASVLLLIFAGFFGSCLLFLTRDVTVKMLPFDNKPEFNVQINLPEGTALPTTANVTRRLAEELLTIPEVTDLQTYVGTASPYNFNGLVRHTFLRQEPWLADIQVMLTDKDVRERSSHEIAQHARAMLSPLGQSFDARLAVVEMPPGPPVLQTLVAEVHGSDDDARRALAAELTTLFENTPDVVDVDNYMQGPLKGIHFVASAQKAVRRGIPIETINQYVDMSMGGYKLGDAKQESGLEPVHITLQVPMWVRSQPTRMQQMPIPTPDGRSIPLAELGNFRVIDEDPLIFHKDLRPVEYVVADMEGRLGAPIYGMLHMEERVKEPGALGTTTPIETGWVGPPTGDAGPGFEWSGEWTVTYETFRDMGIAFAVALILIYILVVWEFGNFVLPLIIMTPIPLTMIGIVPGHWLFQAEFTATSMIGFIALAGIIVRNSILLVDFSINEVVRGQPVHEAVLSSGVTRMRPIFITQLTLMAGAAAIIFDPIFQGMAISLLFGTFVATLLTLVVIPLGCLFGEKHLLAAAAAIHGTPAPKPADDPPPRPKPTSTDTATDPWTDAHGHLVWSQPHSACLDITGAYSVGGFHVHIDQFKNRTR